MEEHPIIYTVGSSTRTLDEFVGLLRGYGVELVVDVRRWPRSRFEHFAKEHLSSHLAKAGIAYQWMGDTLGGFREGGYEAYMETQAFASGLQQLEREAGHRSVAVMCSERVPWRCHRRFIGDALERRGWQVVHALDEDRTWRRRLPSEGQGCGPEESTRPT